MLRMGLLALAGSLAAVTAATAQTPPPGTRWINRSVDQTGGIQLTTYTVLEPESFRGQSAFRVSDALGVQFFERAGRNWFATVLREKERTGSTPHQGTLAWPLEVGKSWVSIYQYRDDLRNLRFNNVTTTWRVATEEDLTVPAGSYKTLRLEGSNNGNTWVTWYAPSLRLVVKEIHERRPAHPAGPGRTVTEIVRYAAPGRDPLASSLLLGPGGKDDGRLEVREIFGLDLSAQLVVLSACETGLGKLSTGDELIGLQRAFLYAGTPAVVTTLWKVDDRASFVLMREFYDGLAKADTGVALQAAQRAAMKEFPHPFAWAAFGLTGVGR